MSVAYLSGQYVASPITVPCRVMLAALLLIGGGVLFAPELRRWARRRRRAARSGRRPRLTRRVGRAGDGGRHRGGYGPWPVHQPGRLLCGRHAAPRRTATRGYHGGNRLRGQGQPRRLRDCGCAGTGIGRHGSDSPAERER
jgi:hypothetical protein